MEIKGTYTDSDSTVSFNGVSEVINKGTAFDSMEGDIIWNKEDWECNTARSQVYLGQAKVNLKMEKQACLALL